MTLTPWLLNGEKLLDTQGRPFICEECPCDEQTCAERLETTYREMLADSEWRFIVEARARYDCDPSASDISYDGTLIVLMARDLTFSSPYKYALHCYEFEHVQTGTHRTIACLCGCGSDYAFAVLDGYGISIIVEADPQRQCTPADLCEVYKAELDYVAEWHGGTLYDEGFFDWLGSNDDWHYQPFLKAIVYDAEESDSTAPTTTRIAWISCQCTGRASSQYKGGEIGVHHVHNFCSEPCQDLLVLRERAVRNGWTWHDAGIIACPAFYWDQDYETWEITCHVCNDMYDQVIKCMGCADDGQGHWVFVRCGCWEGIETISKADWEPWDWMLWDSSCEPPETDYFEIEWICECFEQRELLLAYPELFGVESIIFGSDQIVEVTTTWEDPADGSTQTTTSKTTLGRLMGVDENYIDYRTMGVVRRRCRGGWNLICYNAPNSRFGGTHTFTYEQYQPTFLGRMRVPFGNDPDIGNRTGHVVAWWMTPCVARESQCFDNQQDAEDWYNQWGRNPSQPTPCGIRDYFQEAHESLMPPDLSLQYVTGGVTEIVHSEEWEDPDGGIHTDTWSEWCATPDYWCPAGGFRGYHGQAVYYVNWLETNRGWLVNGEDGYFPTLEIKGILQYNGGNCFGHSGVPEYDETLYPSAIDDDMHWCIPGFSYDPWGESDSGSASI